MKASSQHKAYTTRTELRQIVEIITEAVYRQAELTALIERDFPQIIGRAESAFIQNKIEVVERLGIRIKKIFISGTTTVKN